MIYTEDYLRWFREVGQFLEPAGDLRDAGKLDLLKQWGMSARVHELDEALDKAQDARDKAEDAEREAGQLEVKLDKIKRMIELDAGDSPSAVLSEVGKLVGA